MRIQGLFAIILTVGLAFFAAADDRSKPMKDTRPLLAHNVYVSLKDNSPEARQKLLAACKKYLSNDPGIVFYAGGILATELKRDINDLDFDVAIHIVFKDKAAHDRYQGSKEHQQFIAENKDSWKKVRVFDSLVER